MDEPEPEVCGMHASRGQVVGLFIQLLKEDCPFQKTLRHFTQWVWGGREAQFRRQPVMQLAAGGRSAREGCASWAFSAFICCHC